MLSFGDASKAVVATLGLNPSRREFLDKASRELIDGDRRFETLKSLGVRPLTRASDGQLRKVVEACNNYFVKHPYKDWFDKLEPILQAVGASYYDGTACHLDLVQWATDPVWAKISDHNVRSQLLDADAEFLRKQLTVTKFKHILINGSGVIRQFESVMGVTLEHVDTIRGSFAKSKLFVGRLDSGVFVTAWSVNIQSAFGVCKTLKALLARRVGELCPSDAFAKRRIGKRISPRR